MAGQGRPQRARIAGSQYDLRWKYRLSELAWALLILLGPLLATTAWGQEPLDLRLRITWGGGERRLWRGTVSLSEGNVHEPRSLGIEADAPNSLIVSDNKLEFTQRTPVSFDGLDLRVVGPADATLSVELVPIDAPDSVQTVTMGLQEFLSQVAIAHDSQLDDRRNRLQIQRAPGDRLRVRMDRDSLVFSPGEAFAFEPFPHALGLPDGTSLRCTVQLFATGSETSLWKEQHDLRTQDGTTTPMGPMTVPLPNEEGVYEVVASLHVRRFGDALLTSKPLIQRKVQLVVVGEQPRESLPGEWRLVEEIDSANPKWWERWVWIPQWKKLPGIAPPGPLGDQPLHPRELSGAILQEIGPSGWHAAPIPTTRMGEPHILEIEYPRGIRQTLGISILEPDAAGYIGMRGIDSGVDVSGEGTGIEYHRVVFWPRTKAPWLLLTNRRSDAPAVIGKMRVYAGPQHLPPVANERRANGTRLTAAFFEKPLFAEGFGAPEALDGPSNRSLRDWNTYYQGALRLAEYLKYSGYNAAFIPVFSDGSALYPTQLLDATPKYDNGTLFVTGQDPVSKDVLELLLRIFDREGLTLIPVLQYGVPLSELEALRRNENNDWSGIALIGSFPGETVPRLGLADSRKGLAPYYNPLDPRVQSAMRQVAEELLGRCGKHVSFGGLSLQLGPFSYSQFPDDSWGLDDATFARFAQETQLAAPPSGAKGFPERLMLIRGKYREAWLKWRANKLALFYQQLHSDVAATRSSAPLFIDMHELAAGRVFQAGVRPTLPARDEFRDSLLRHGLELSSLPADSGIVLLRPQRVAPMTSLPAQAANLELEQSSVIDDSFRRSSRTGTLVFVEPQPLRVPGFDQVSPFGAEKTYSWLTAEVSPGGVQSRQQLVRSLATLDPMVFATGGWMLPLGQEESLVPVLQVLSQLPAQPFGNVRPRSATWAATSLAVRQLTWNNETYLYIANATGLRARLELDLQDLPMGVAVRNLSDRVPDPITKASPTAWTVGLDPYDVVGVCFSSPLVQVADWRVEFDPEDIDALRRRVNELRVRVSELRSPQPLAVLENPGFEKPGSDGQIAGWRFTNRPGVTYEVDRGTAQSGQSSLHVHVSTNGGYGRVRSNPFPLPKTGRVSVLARLRTSDPSRQPPVRMAVEGKLADGAPFERWSQPLGIAVDSRTGRPTTALARPLPAQWSEQFLFHIVNLPAGTLGEISVGLDILGPGEVWVDDVEVYEMYFQDDERNELIKRIGNAALQLEDREYAACQHFLQGYWPRFVLEFSPPPRIAQNAVEARQNISTPPRQPPRAEKTGWWDRLRSRPIFRFPF